MTPLTKTLLDIAGFNTKQIEVIGMKAKWDSTETEESLQAELDLLKEECVKFGDFLPCDKCRHVHATAVFEKSGMFDEDGMPICPDCMDPDEDDSRDAGCYHVDDFKKEE